MQTKPGRDLLIRCQETIKGTYWEDVVNPPRNEDTAWMKDYWKKWNEFMDNLENNSSQNENKEL